VFVDRRESNSALFIIVLFVILILSTACVGQDPVAIASPVGGSPQSLNVVATTTIVGDIVRAVAGDQVDLRVLLPPKADPHSYEVTPRDVAAIDDADLVFINGLGLESLLEPVLQDAREQSKVISVSDGVTILADVEKGQKSEADPHVWFDPMRVSAWVDNIEKALSQIDPAGSELYLSNAESYRQELADLDQWIIDQFEQVPLEKRVIVTDHDSFGYLVDRYGLDLAGTVIPGYNTLSDPTARDMAELIDNIGQRDARVIFVSDSISSDVSEQIARETGIDLVPLSTGSLTEADGETPTYLEFMRLIVETIVTALLGS
jgi:ABC-type Zn uptake system ZnuABC Zn-binding protein ZnuA